MSLENKKKVFIRQESPLTLIFRTRSGKFFLSLYCLSFALYLISCIGIYFVNPHVAQVEWDFVRSGFFNFRAPFILWAAFHAILIIVFFPLTQEWVSREWNTSCLIFSGSILLPSFILSASFMACFLYPMGILCKVFIGMEAIRLSMKVISFTSEVALKLQLRQQHIHCKATDHNRNKLPVACVYDVNSKLYLGHFAYFLFCPTAIYRDSYPMKKSVDIKRVLIYLLLLFSLTFIGLKLAVATSAPFFSATNATSIPISLVVQSLPFIISTTLYTVLVGVGIAFIDVWSNIFAEILRFGDRGFYQDWWTQHDILCFLMKWNNINQNWLFEYIYEPYRSKYGKKFAGLLVMAVSGFFHDYLFISTFSIFLPICSGGQISAWIISQFLPHRRKFNAGNLPQTDRKQQQENTTEEEKIPSLITFMGSTYNFFGFAIIYLFCQLEYYSRMTCHVTEPGIIHFVTPRLFTCLEWA